MSLYDYLREELQQTLKEASRERLDAAIDGSAKESLLHTSEISKKFEKEAIENKLNFWDI